MKLRRPINPFFISVVLVCVVTTMICVFSFACSGSKLNFNSVFYFVCYSSHDNSVSASSISGAVSSYGGAGYILEYEDTFYITVACYYNQNDADTVCKSLKNRELDCTVLKIETDEYRLPNGTAKKCAELYRGNLNTLNSLSAIAYECANAMDTGEYNQSNAKNVIDDVKSALNGLLSANPDNCFSTEILRLINVCEDVGGGFVYSKDLRKLQIAIADTIINIRF